MAEPHEFLFALEAHEARKRLEQTPPAPDVPFLQLLPLGRMLLGLGMLALNVWLWGLILFR